MQQLCFCKVSNPAQNLLVVNSFLPRIRGFGRETAANQRALGLCFLEQRPKTTYMLLQSFFLLFLPCNLQQRRKIRFSSKNSNKNQISIKTVTLPGNGAKIWLKLYLHTKYRILDLRIKMCKCSILTAIAIGYAGRDHKEGLR